MLEMDPRKRAFVGPVLVLILALLAELAGHGLGFDLAAVTLLLLALAPIAYAGLRSGFWNAAGCSLILAVYTLHYIAPHAQGLKLDGEGWASFAVILVLGAGMAWPMDRVRRREERLRHDVEARTRDLEARNRELMNANASLEAFGYVVSHDLKEPVRALENYLDAARNDWPSEDGRVYVEEAYAANRRLARLLHGLLSYSRTSSSPAAAEPVPLPGLILGDDCSSQYAPLQRERGANVQVDGELPEVLGDRVMLAQLFGNLVLNAIRHHPKAAHVRVRLVEAGGGIAHLAVEDDGPGFPPDVLARFHRLDAGRPATIKAGFGLAIAQRAAQRLGGKLWLENLPQGGAAAHVELPLGTPAGSSEVRKGRIALDTGDDPKERLVSRR